MTFLTKNFLGIYDTHFLVILVLCLINLPTAHAGMVDFLKGNQIWQMVFEHFRLALQVDLPIHALTMHLFTLAEWQANASVPASPPCLGGSHAP